MNHLSSTSLLENLYVAHKLRCDLHILHTTCTEEKEYTKLPRTKQRAMKLLKAIMVAVSMRSVLSFVPAVVTATGKNGLSNTAATTAVTTQRHLFNQLFSSSTTSNSKYPIMADESIMSKKQHGTSDEPVQKNLRWNCDNDTADRIW